MQDSRPLVSVIIPSFNREALIGDTLLSVQNQSYSNWECIIVDDGSTDRTRQVVQDFTSQDQRFKFFERHQKPKGAPTCRNIGIEKSVGEYIMFLDSDDQLMSFCLSKRIKVAGDAPQYDAHIFRTNTFNSKTKETKELLYTSKLPELYGFISHCFPLPWNIMSPLWKRDSLLRLNGFNEKYPRFQDPELHTRAILKGYQFYHSLTPPDSIYFIHQHEATKEEIRRRQELALKGLNYYIEDISQLCAKREDHSYILKLMANTCIHFMCNYFDNLNYHKGILDSIIGQFKSISKIKYFCLKVIITLSNQYWIPGLYRINRLMLFKTIKY